MSIKSKRAIGYLICICVLTGMGIMVHKLTAASHKSSEAELPPYHQAPPEGPLPATLSPREFNDPVVRTCYTMASKIEDTLYQLPCYCFCWKMIGHKSLLDCYLSKHAAECKWCQQEAIYAYIHLREGETAAQIRQGLRKGEWKAIDLAEYKSVRYAH
jgi:hypothetical protein